MKDNTKERVVYIFLIIFMLFLIFINSVSAETLNLGITDGNFNVYKLVLTKNDKLESNINYQITEVSDGEFYVSYSLNESVKNMLIDNKKNKNKDFKQNIKGMKNLEDVKIDKYLDEFENFPVVNLSSNKVKFYDLNNNSINSINLSEDGIFIVKFEGMNKLNKNEYINQKIKIGFESTEFELMGYTITNRFNSPNILIDSTGKRNLFFSIEADSLLGYDSGIYHCNETTGTMQCNAIFSNVIIEEGQQSLSVDLDNSDNFHISYYDSDNGDLRYCNNTIGSWSCLTVNSTGDIGKYNIINIDSGNKAHIITSSDSMKNISYCNNTLGSWECSVAKSLGSRLVYGMDSTLDSNNFSHILYYSSNPDYHSYCNNTAGAWSCYTFGATYSSLTSGVFIPSIKIDTNDKVHILIRDAAGTPETFYGNNTAGDWSFYELDNGVGYTLQNLIIDKYGKLSVNLINAMSTASYYGSFYNNIRGSFSVYPEVGSSYFTTLLGLTTSQVEDNLYYKGSNRMLGLTKGRASNPLNNLDDIPSLVLYTFSSGLSNLYLIEFENPYLNVTINAPLNNSYLTSNIMNISSISYLTELNNLTVFMWNSSGSIINQTNISLTGTNIINESIISLDYFQEGQFTLKALLFNQDNTSTWSSNKTFYLDLNNPSVNLSSYSTSLGSTTVYFTSNISDTYLNSSACKFWVYNISGQIDNSNSNISFTCNTLTSFSTSSLGNFNLTISATDLASRQSNFTQQITLNPSSAGGGGSNTLSLFSSVKIPVIGLNAQNLLKNYTLLEKEVVYAKINDQCLVRLRNFQSIATADYSEVCTLYPDDFTPIMEQLGKVNIYIYLEDIYKFYQSYKRQDIFQGFEQQSIINEYGLFTSILGNVNELSLSPPTIDLTKFIIGKDDELVIEQIVYSNKPLRNCEIIGINSSFDCYVTNGTLRIKLTIEDKDFFSKVFRETIIVTTDASSSEIEQKRIPVIFRVYNLEYNIFPGVTSYLLILVSGGLIVLMALIYYRKYNKNKNSKIKEFFS